MIIFTCDKCGEVVAKAPDAATGVTVSRQNGFIVKPGYLGTKFFCRNCWNLWSAHVRAFFTKAN